MNLDEARVRLEECIQIMENKKSFMSYAAIVNHPRNDGYAVEFGTYERMIGFYDKMLRDDLLNIDQKPTTKSTGRLLQKIKEHIRPIKAGTSISDSISVDKAGTLGILLSFKENSKIYGLTNMHVASSFYSSSVEDPDIQITSNHQDIIQPSSVDRASLRYDMIYETPIGKTVWKVFNSKTDVALIEIDKSENFAKGLFNCELSNLDPYNYNNLKLNRNAHKQGRTTGYTSGEILSIEAAIKIKNPFKKINNLGEYIVFRDQIMTENIADSGDSGSVLISNNQIVGLTFADINFNNSDTNLLAEEDNKQNGRTFHNKINNIIDAIEIEDETGQTIKPTFNKFHV